MRRTRWVTGAVGVLVAVVLAVALTWYATRPYPCRATFERVKEGMTRAEVEATVGGPPGDYSGGRAFPRRAWADSWAPDPGGTSWVAVDGELMVWFDPAGTVTRTDIEDVLRLTGPTVLARLRAMLGR